MSPETILTIDRNDSNTLAAWTLLPDDSSEDGLFAAVLEDQKQTASILELFRLYMGEVRTNPDNDALPFRKLQKLFTLGLTPYRVEGHHFGIPLCFRTGDLEEPMASMGNVLQVLWGTTLEGQSPWVGKSFSAITDAVADAITLGSSSGTRERFLGINHFNEIPLKVGNNISFQALNLLMHFEAPSPEEQKDYGCKKNGCRFIANQDRSLYRPTARDVFRLNYRWTNLKNIAPLCWLIDEIVQVAAGLYLGQLLFATDELIDPYSPDRSPDDYRYQHFGYFLLFDDDWNKEARRLFPFLEIPENAPGLSRPSVTDLTRLSKFSTFTFEETAPPLGDNGVYRAVLDDMKDKATILHLLKDYSDRLQSDADNTSPYFRRVLEIFNRGIGIADMEGYYHGALVSWHSEGVFKLFDINTLNLVWTGLAMKFSTWTGKSFEAITKDRLQEITDGHEKGAVPTRWGANTQALRTFKERFVGNLMDVGHVWTEKVPSGEASANGYDVKNFFFISHQATSISEASKGKTVYQFNYRWPRLKTIIPDRFCIDEIVRIAQGLYLGQLMYATNILLPYSPDTDPAAYAYRNFGFFLLMDDEWNEIRLKTGYDLSNT